MYQAKYCFWYSSYSAEDECLSLAPHVFLMNLLSVLKGIWSAQNRLKPLRSKCSQGGLPYHPGRITQFCWRVSSCVTFFITVQKWNNLEVLHGKHIKFTKKRENIIIVHGTYLFIFQMVIVKLRNWIIPFKLARLLVTHDGGKLTRVGELIPSWAFTRQVG